MSDTPRADAKDYELRNLADGERYTFMLSFARSRERENATLTAEVERKQAALQEVIAHLGPKVPRHITCVGCDYEWQHALDAARRAVLPVGGAG